MTIREHRQLQRRTARTIAHLAGGRVSGRAIRHSGTDHRDTMRLHDTLSNAGVAVGYNGDGDAIQLR